VLAAKSVPLLGFGAQRVGCELPREPLHPRSTVTSSGPATSSRVTVVTGRTEPSRYKNNLGPRENVSQRALNGIAIGNCALFVNAKPKLKNFARNKGKMSIEHVTEQNFRSGIDDDCFQRALPPCHVERSRDISILFPEGTIVRDSSTPLGMTIVAAVYDRRQRQFRPQLRCDYAASLSCFLRMSGSFFPSTTCAIDRDFGDVFTTRARHT
jgi:hypothetical protein